MSTSDSPKWTKEQLQAIEDCGRSLLVSAGAGSGKTTVLTERIMRKITSENDPHNITDFLIVSFNKASASDLKRKISKELKKRLVAIKYADPHLKKQQILINQARISTMHSFCLKLVKENIEKLNLPVNVNIGSDSEMNIVKRNVLEEVLELFYGGNPEFYRNFNFTVGEFLKAIENFLGKKTDETAFSILLQIHKKAQNNTEKFEFMQQQIELASEIINLEDGDDENFFKTQFGIKIAEFISFHTDYYFDNMELFKESINFTAVHQKKYEKSFVHSFNFLRKLRELSEYDTGTSYNRFSQAAESFKAVAIGKHSVADDIHNLRLQKCKNRIKKSIAKINDLFSYSFDTVKMFAKQYKKNTFIISEVLKTFDNALLNEKKRLKMYEFSDLERFAYQLLVEKNNTDIKRTELALKLQHQFREIYIDEYQDTNDIQDAIFKSISTEDDNFENGNRFMVGDIKQSIYAYRGANSDIFAEYSKKFTLCSKENDRLPHKIFLSHNFRSDGNIINFINEIFKVLLKKTNKTMEYEVGEHLVFGKNPKDDKGLNVEFTIIENFDKTDETDMADITDMTEDKERATDEKIEFNEAEYTALKIKNIIKNGFSEYGRKIKYSDIAILTRNKKNNPYFSDALRRYGIPCYSDDSEGFLNCSESLLFLSLLHTVNNPNREIYLVACLKSPIFSFTLDNLVKIKAWSEMQAQALGVKSKNLYICMINYAEYYKDATNENIQNEFYYDKSIKEKILNFIDKLNTWREKSKGMPADKFIWYLFKQTEIFFILSKEENAMERKSNIMLFYEYARTFEMSSYKGLYSFLSYIDDIINNNENLNKAKSMAETSDTVRIMTVHKSKGLEFPVCFLVNNSSNFNSQDSIIDPIINDKTGIYYKLKAEDSFGKYQTPMRILASHENSIEMLNEESRILYVALTRAMNKLIVLCNVKSWEKFKSDIYEDTENSDNVSLSVHDKKNNSKRMGSILIDFIGQIKPHSLRNIVDMNIITQETLNRLKQNYVDENTKIESGKAEQSEKINLRMKDNYLRRLEKMYNYDRTKEYKNKILSKIPAKLSVTDLHPGILEDNEYSRIKNKNTDLAALPKFMEGERVTAVETGTATHLCMQFINFANAEKYGLAAEIKRLLNSGFISQKQYDIVNIKKIEKFFRSSLYNEIKSAIKIYREMRFNLKVPVSDFMNDEKHKLCENEFVLVQGAIDLFYINQNKNAVVVDFKTDRIDKKDKESLVKRYNNQLKYYTKAVYEMTGYTVEKSVIYSFWSDEEIAVQCESICSL